MPLHDKCGWAPPVGRLCAFRSMASSSIPTGGADGEIQLIYSHKGANPFAHWWSNVGAYQQTFSQIKHLTTHHVQPISPLTSLKLLYSTSDKDMLPLPRINPYTFLCLVVISFRRQSCCVFFCDMLLNKTWFDFLPCPKIVYFDTISSSLVSKLGSKHGSSPFSIRFADIFISQMVKSLLWLPLKTGAFEVIPTTSSTLFVVLARLPTTISFLDFFFYSFPSFYSAIM